MRRPAVAVVTSYYRPVLGGAEAAAERLAAFLSRRGHRVLVLTKRTSLANPATERIDGVDIERLGPVGERSGPGKWAVAPSLCRALLRHRRDIDVVCCVDYRAVGLAALAARTLTGTPVVFQAQTEGVMSGARVREALARIGVARDGAIAGLLTWPVRAMYGRADGIGCISRGIERETLAAGVPRAKVHYLPNPVNTQLFAPLSLDARRAARARLLIRDEAVVAVFVGRLSREKGVLELVRAWARAKPRALLVLVGPEMTGHAWDVSAEARRIVGESGQSESVRFVGGQPAAEVAAWLGAADFGVQPSHFEAMGLAAAEAMAAGLPVVASDTGGYRDFISHEQNGLLVPIGDVDALAAAVTRLVDDSSLRHRLGQAARATAGQFDEQVILEQFAGILEQVTARG